MSDFSFPESVALAHFAPDVQAGAEAFKARHGDAFLVIMPGVLGRPPLRSGPTSPLSPRLGTTGEVAPAGFRVCVVRPREPEPGGYIAIGRHRKNDVVVAHESVSKVHAHLRRYGRSYDLQDQGSRNGTYLDDQRLAPRCKPELVRSGARLRFGSADSLFLLFDEFWRFVARMMARESRRMA